MTECKCLPFKQALDCPTHPMTVTRGRESHRLQERCLACNRDEGTYMCILCAAMVNAEELAPDPHYACGAAYCDDTACTVHNHAHPNHE